MEFFPSTQNEKTKHYVTVVLFEKRKFISQITYSSYTAVEIGDIVEVPYQNSRSKAVVFETNIPKPEFETKNIGAVLAKKIFSKNFLFFLQSTENFSFQGKNLFLPLAIPQGVLENNFFPPSEEIFLAGEKIFDANGKKQKEIAKHLEKQTFFSHEWRKTQKISLKTLEKMLENQILEKKWKERFKFSISGQFFHKNFQKNSEFHSQKNIFLGSNFSGKFAAMLEWIERIVNEKKQVLILVPDFFSALQLEKKLGKIADKNQLCTWEGKKNTKGNEELFWKIYCGEISVIIATKNSLFFPFKHLGGIAVHEYPDSSFKTHNSPFFSASRIAKIRCKTEKIPLLLMGTCGETQEIFEIEDEENGKIFAFSNEHHGKIHVVNMNNEKKGKEETLLSEHLKMLLKKNLEEKKISVLFINRKGMHKVLLCRTCMWSPFSPVSGERMSIIQDKNSGEEVLYCASSGHREKMPYKCPKCSSTELVKKSFGTQKAEIEAKKNFPNARIVRIDGETLTKKSQVEKLIYDIENGEVDILVGTQIVLKIFPAKKISLVASLHTENDFLFPSFDAEEKGFWQLQRVLDIPYGFSKESEVLLQTYIPNHPLLEKAIQKDFIGLYTNEIQQRKLLGFPPFLEQIEISYSGKKKETVLKKMKEAQKVLQKICEKSFPIEVSYHPRKKNFTGSAQFFFHKKNESSLRDIYIQKEFSHFLWKRV